MYNELNLWRGVYNNFISCLQADEMSDSPLTVMPWSRLYLRCRAMGEMVGGLPVMISTWVTLVYDDKIARYVRPSPTHLHAGLAAQVPLGHGHGEHVGAGHQRAGRQHCVVTRRGTD